MLKNELYKKIAFIDKEDIIEDVEDSHSGAKVLKIIKPNESYFLKMSHYSQSDEIKVKKIVEAYLKLNNNLYIVDNGVIKEDNIIWVVYNWINGVPLNKLYEQSSHDFYKYGHKIGRLYRTLNTFFSDSFFNDDYSLQALANEVKDNFNVLYNEKEIFNNNFKITTLNIISKIYDKIIPIIENSKREYIHGDLHPKNVMLNDEKHLVIVDIESFRYDYFVMNFRWSLGSIYKHEENKLFFRGFIDGRFGENKPKELNNQIIFMLIFKFYEQTVTYYKSGKNDILKEYIVNFNKIFDSIDFSKKDINILD